MKEFFNKKTIYKIFSVIVAFLCVSVFCMPITNNINNAKLMAQNISNSSSYATSNSSAYYIKDSSGLSKINSYLSSGGSYRFYLLSNIIVYNHTPIGTASIPFKGEFFGNGFTITIMSFKTTSEKYAGIFGYISGANISNLNVNIQANYTSSNTTHFGCLAGYVGRACTISNCRNIAKKDISVSLSSSTSYLGALVGESKVTLDNCINNQSIVSSANYAGGIVGSCAYSVTNCINYGKIKAENLSVNSNFYLGGIAGYCDTTSNCYNMAQITSNLKGSSENTNVYLCHGGIVGYAVSNVKECFNTGKVQASKNYFTFYIGGVGGYVGNLIEQSSNNGHVNLVSSYNSKFYLGGVAGRVSNANSCINSGKVSSDEITDYGSINYCIGGVFGLADKTSYNNLYNSGEISIASFANNSVISNVGTIIGKLSQSSVTFSSCVNAKESEFALEDKRVMNGIMGCAAGFDGLTKVYDSPWWNPFESDVYADPYENKTGTLYYNTSIKTVGNCDITSGIEEYKTQNNDEAIMEFNVFRYEESLAYNFYREAFNRTLRFKIKDGKVYLVNKLNGASSSWSGEQLIMDISNIGEDQYELIGLYDIADVSTETSFIYGDSKPYTFPYLIEGINHNDPILYNRKLGAWFYNFPTATAVVHTNYVVNYCSVGLQTYETSDGEKVVGYNDNGSLLEFGYMSVGPVGFVYNKENNTISMNFFFGFYTILGSEDSSGINPGGGNVYESSEFFSYEFAKLDLDAVSLGNSNVISSNSAKSKIDNFATNLGWISYNGGYIKLETF